MQGENGDKHVDACRNYTLGGVGVPHQAVLQGGDQEDDHGRLHEGQFYRAAEQQQRAAKDDDSAAEAALAMFKSKKPKSEKKEEPKKSSGSTDGATDST